MRLLIDHRAYPSACTLAGAAEELLGKQLGEMAVFRDLKSVLSNANGVTPNVAGEALNFARNWMKHSGKGDDVLAHDWEAEAIQSIARALTNLIRMDKPLPPEAVHFRVWVREHRPELGNKN